MAGDSLFFVVPGEPRGKGRPRSRFVPGGAPIYTDNRTITYENLVKVMALNAGATKMEGPLAVFIAAFLKIPKSAPKAKAAQMRAGQILPTKKPDFDNICKAVVDGLNDVAFADDAQIAECMTIKRFADEPRLEVTVRQITGDAP